MSLSNERFFRALHQWVRENYGETPIEVTIEVDRGPAIRVKIPSREKLRELRQARRRAERQAKLASLKLAEFKRRILAALEKSGPNPVSPKKLASDANYGYGGRFRGNLRKLILYGVVVKTKAGIAMGDVA